jgi:hypothetical protein
MDCLHGLVIRTRLCNKLKLNGEGLDLSHCKCRKTKRLQVQLPATGLLRDLRLTVSVSGREDSEKTLLDSLWILSHLLSPRCRGWGGAYLQSGHSLPSSSLSMSKSSRVIHK